jgi:transcription elongation factor GreA
MIQRFPMTQEGANSLQQELHRLQHIERPRIIQAIAEARELGDLKENAEYHAAKEEQAFNEGRIQELQAKIAAAHIIDVTQLPYDGRVVFGATVTLVNLETNKMDRFKIVGDDEVDIRLNKISLNAPLARAIIGKKEGDDVELQTPSGEVEYHIKKVEYLA